MSSVVISGDTSGAITLSAPAVSGTNTATLPAATGTVMVSGNMPAFSVYRNSAQSIANSTYTKIQLDTENFDTANCFDSTTNYRFTPTVAGYYQINGLVCMGGSTLSITGSAIYKNGSIYCGGSVAPNNVLLGGNSGVSSLIYFNGSTDYVELYVWQGSGGSLNTQSGNAFVQFSGSLVRTA
jgi:hypothetical protein